jgi:hypothetical protein
MGPHPRRQSINPGHGARERARLECIYGQACPTRTHARRACSTTSKVLQPATAALRARLLHVGRLREQDPKPPDRSRGITTMSGEPGQTQSACAEKRIAPPVRARSKPTIEQQHCVLTGQEQVLGVISRIDDLRWRRRCTELERDVARAADGGPSDRDVSSDGDAHRDRFPTRTDRAIRKCCEGSCLNSERRTNHGDLPGVVSALD